MKIQIYFLLLCSLYQSLIAQQTEATLPKVENHLKGDLDYTHEVLELVQKQINGKDMRVGQIHTDGTIHFNLPEFNIKRLYDSINLQHPKFQQLFEINSDCKDLDPFVKTPFDEVYSQKYNPIYVKKYNTYIAALYPVSDTIIVSRNNNNRTLLPSEATYFWFYIDRAIAYKDDCTKISYHTGDAYTKISANVQFEKGSNYSTNRLYIYGGKKN